MSTNAKKGDEEWEENTAGVRQKKCSQRKPDVARMEDVRWQRRLRRCLSLKKGVYSAVKFPSIVEKDMRVKQNSTVTISVP